MAKKEIDLDEILLEVGQFGRFQIRNLALILLPILLCAVYNSQYVFAAASVPYRCRVPECEVSPPKFDTNGWGSWALPDSGGRCERYVPTGTICDSDSFHPTETELCTSWVYEHNESIVSTFDLACKDWKRTLVGTMHSVGIFFALAMSAYISDNLSQSTVGLRPPQGRAPHYLGVLPLVTTLGRRVGDRRAGFIALKTLLPVFGLIQYGRRMAFVITAVTPAVVGLGRSFSQTYVTYVTLEFLEAVVTAGVYSSGFVLAVEMMGLNRRVLGGNMISCTFALGQAVVALIAWAVPEWRTLTRILYVPSFGFIIYYFLIEESVRWLLSKGRRQEAAKIIFKAAEVNKRKLSPETIKLLTEEFPADEDTSKTGKEEIKTVTEPDVKQQSLVLQVLKSRIIMTRLCICSFWWITVTFIYYGLSINSVSLVGNSYVNYILTALVEIPGYFLSFSTLDRFGRKSSIMTAYFICGVSLIGLPFVPEDLQWLQTCLNLLGKLCISMVFSSIYIYTSELYPTTVRQSLLSACSMIGRIGNIFATQSPLLMENMKSLPYLMFGVMAAISALLMLLTPETLNMTLPDTVEQAENIISARGKRTTNVVVDRVNDKRS